MLGGLWLVLGGAAPLQEIRLCALRLSVGIEDVEDLIRYIEKNGGEVVVVTVGPEAAAATIRSALAMGAARAILVKVPAQFLDSSVTADALHAAIEADGSEQASVD